MSKNDYSRSSLQVGIAASMLNSFLLVMLLVVMASVLAKPNSLENSMLLVATDNMPDPRFAKSVVLVTRHNKNGPVGVIINHPLNIELQYLFPGKQGLIGNIEKAFYGGPAAGQIVVFLLRTENQPRETMHVFDNVYMSLSKPLFEQTLQRENPTEGLRVFIGYAGWTEGQLEREIDNGYWNIKTPDHETVYSEAPDQLWHKLSKEYRGEWVKLPTETGVIESETQLTTVPASYLASH